MAAPYFCTPLSLSSDLAALGYPLSSEKRSIDSSGAARLQTLRWLACLIDPSFQPDGEKADAAFWDHLGLQSSPPNSSGFRLPFTADSERVRDRHAANTFLRTAIDLAIAAQRRRARNPSPSPSSQTSDDDDARLRPVFSEEDIAANIQLDTLINHRHVFFPNTLTILHEHSGKKRRPLVQKKASLNRSRSDSVSSRIRAGGKDGAAGGGPRSREEILEHLRSMQRESRTLPEVGLEAGGSDSGRGCVNTAADVDGGSIRSVAKICTSLISLMQRFRESSSQAVAFRGARPSLAIRDVEADERTTELAADCVPLAANLEQSTCTMESVRKSMQRLSQGRKALESLPNSSGVRAVVERCQQTVLF